MGKRRRSSTTDGPLAELAALQRDNARLQERLDALCQAADIWISLYERQLARANYLAAECRRLRTSRTAPPSWTHTTARPLRLTLATPPARRKASGENS